MTGPAALCGNSDTTYNINNSATFPTGTTFVWQVSSFNNNPNLTVTPNQAGTQAKVHFGNMPGVDTLKTYAVVTGGCAGAQTTQVLTTNPLPLNQSNITTSLYADYSDGKGEILKDKRKICVGNQVKLEAKGNTNTLLNRVGVPSNSITYTWNLTSANIIPVLPSSPTVRNISYSTTGNYPFTFNGSNTFGCTQTLIDTFKVKDLVCGECLQAKDSSLLQNIPEVWTMSEIDASTYPNGKVVLDGIFFLKNNITLKNGTFSFKPGSALIMDSVSLTSYPSSGPYAFPNFGPQIYADNATILLNSSSLVGCNLMWNGLNLYNNSNLISIGSPARYSKIRDMNALFCDYLSPKLNFNFTIFENNWVSILSYRSIIVKNSIFTSNQMTFSPPFNMGSNFGLNGFSEYGIISLNGNLPSDNLLVDSCKFENISGSILNLPQSINN
ncbi:MAG: hypothetical protein K2Q22_07825, partial [Cytophagales bacterium]|nr:hypothetical protein [Cytophagales bacterium]